MLPDHLIVEHILPKLPVKSLVLFRSVCKIWHATISSQNFAKSHFQLSSSSSPRHLLVTGTFEDYNGPLRSNFGINLGELGIYKRLLETPPELITGNIAGSCHGLVCLRNRNALTIWNPATGQLRENVPCPTEVWFSFACGFGYDSYTNDYKIVVANHGQDNVFVFSLRTGKWNNARSLDKHGFLYGFPPFPSKRQNKSVLVDSILYWSPESPLNGIVSFDFNAEELVKNPDMHWLSKYKFIDFVRINGCLSCCCRRYYAKHPGVYDVWMLKQHGDWNSWAMLSSVDFHGFPVFNLGEIDSKLLLYNPYVVRLVTLTQDGLRYLKKETMAKCHRMRTPEPWIYVESLIWPFQEEGDSHTSY